MEKFNELILVAGLITLAFWVLGEALKDKFAKFPTWLKILVFLILFGLAVTDVLWQQTAAIESLHILIPIPIFRSQPLEFSVTMPLYRAALLALFAIYSDVFKITQEEKSTPNKIDMSERPTAAQTSVVPMWFHEIFASPSTLVLFCMMYYKEYTQSLHYDTDSLFTAASAIGLAAIFGNILIRRRARDGLIGYRVLRRVLLILMFISLTVIIWV